MTLTLEQAESLVAAGKARARAVGVSGGHVAQDFEIAQAATAALTA